MENANKINAFACKKRRALLLNDIKANATTAQTGVRKRIEEGKSMRGGSIEEQILLAPIFHNRIIEISGSSNRINKYVKYNKDVK